MSKTDEKIKRDRLSNNLIIKNREKLIEKGSFPKKYLSPAAIQFEVTSNCNLKCKHCYNSSGVKRKKDLIDGDKWIDFCKYLVSKGGVFQATISGGEPLLLGDKLWKMMDILHDDGTIFNLISNGYLFNLDILNHLKKYNFYWVQYSIDNYIPDLHDDFRGVKGSWDRVAKAAYLTALAGIPVRIASTITPKDIDHLEDFIKMAINLGASYYVIGEVIPSGRAFNNPEIFLSKEDRDLFYIEMDKLIKKYKNNIKILVSGAQRVQLEYSSSSAIDGAIIRPNGNIRLDCGCPFVIGNILKDDIFEVWAKKSDCWKNPLVQKYIESCDPITGFSSFINNYKDEDIFI